MNYDEIVDGLYFDYKKYQEWIIKHDAEALKDFNASTNDKSPYFLHEKIGPCPFEGDPQSANVILLLANPGYDSNSKPADHQPIGGGWGLWGLSREAPETMHDWWRPRLKSFVQPMALEMTDIEDPEYPWMELSQKVASIQALPWASEKFNESANLPSKHLMAAAVRNLVYQYPMKIFVVVRQRKFWQSVLNQTHAQVIYTKNPRCSYITKNNIQGEENWELIFKMLANSEMPNIKIWRNVEIGKWLKAIVSKPPKPQKMEILDIEFDWEVFEGSFAIRLDDTLVPQRLGLYVSGSGQLEYSVPYASPPHYLHFMESFPVIEFDTQTGADLRDAINKLLPKLAGLGRHPVTSQMVGASTPMKDRILDVSEFTRAKEKLNNTATVAVKLK